MARPCSLCSTLSPVELVRVRELYRIGRPFVAIASELKEAGYGFSRDAVSRHCNRDLAPFDPADDDVTPDPVGLLVAIHARDCLTADPVTARTLAELLLADGCEAAASIVAQAMTTPSDRELPSAVRGTSAEWRIEAEILASSLRTCLVRGHPEVARELADELRRRRADDLADGMESLAQSAERISRAKAAITSSAGPVATTNLGRAGSVEPTTKE